jgi:regulation of enolase protein 1 (concanavalin A-like superfamily)
MQIPPLRPGRGRTFLLSVCVLHVGAACSVLVDAERQQCKTTGDCTKRGKAFAGFVCSKSVCVKGSGSGGTSADGSVDTGGEGGGNTGGATGGSASGGMGGEAAGGAGGTSGGGQGGDGNGGSTGQGGSTVTPPPPSAPGGLVANTAAGQVDLSWILISTTATYTVKRGTSASGPFDDLASGVAASTYADTTAAADTLYYYTVSATEGAATSPNAVPVSAAAATSTAGAWLTQDIGSVAVPGSFTVSCDTYTVKGSGSDIWYSSDQFRFVFVALTGDFSLSARVVSLTNTAPFAKVGLMIRETLDPSSKYVIHDMSPANGAIFESRPSTAGSSVRNGIVSTSRAPIWLRLVRSGTTFTSYVSSDGASWNIMGTTTVSMTDGVYAGMEVCSVASGSLCQGVFDNVSKVGKPTPPTMDASTCPDVGTSGVLDSSTDRNWDIGTNPALDSSTDRNRDIGTNPAVDGSIDSSSDARPDGAADASISPTSD